MRRPFPERDSPSPERIGGFMRKDVPGAARESRIKNTRIDTLGKTFSIEMPKLQVPGMSIDIITGVVRCASPPSGLCIRMPA